MTASSIPPNRTFKTAADFHDTFPETSIGVKIDRTSLAAEAALRDSPDYAVAKAKGGEAGEKFRASFLKAFDEAGTQERARAESIFNNSEIQGREDLARHLYGATDMTAEAVARALRASPRVTPPAATRGGGLRAEMAAMQQPQLGAGGDFGPRTDPNTPAGKAEEGAATAARLLGKTPQA